MENQIRLDSLLARDVGVQWFEGVALVHSLCQALLTSGIANPEFPSPSHVSLGADGTVALPAPAPGNGAVRKAASVLALMLNDDVPVRLRLLVTQATEDNQCYATLGQFADGLAYFARPEPRQILRLLYERAVAAAVRAEPLKSLELHPTLGPEPPASVPPVRPRYALKRVALLVAGTAVTLGGVAWAVASGSRDPRLAGVLDRVRASFTAAVSVGNDAASSPTANNEQTTQRPAASRAADSSRRSDADRGREVHGVVSAPASIPDLSVPELAPMPASGRPDGRWALDASRLVFGDAEPLAITASHNWSADAERVYTKEDVDAKLPRSLYPKLPPDPPVTSGNGRTILELIISPDGRVERVRLRTPPRDVHEFMMVSAAKAWVFEPATVDGQPVRFLHRVPITTNEPWKTSPY